MKFWNCKVKFYCRLASGALERRKARVGPAGSVRGPIGSPSLDIVNSDFLWDVVFARCAVKVRGREHLVTTHSLHTIMASPLVGRSPTCLSCIRRINQVGSASISLTQVRGKKTEGRLKGSGVVVRLLKDVKKFGKEGK